MKKQKILVCIDGSSLSKAVCDYAIFLAKKLNLPLVLLNVIEHSHTPKKINLSGSIGLGAKEDLLEQLSDEEQKESKELIKKSKKTLKEFEAYVKDCGITDSQIIQKHGSLEEILNEYSSQAKIAVMGIKGVDSPKSKKIGNHIKESVRTLNIPVLLVNNDFKPIQSILMAYDGSEFSKKAFKVAILNPVFPDTKRYIVNVNKDAILSTKLLKEAETFFNETNFEIETKSLQGDVLEELLKYQDENNIDIIAMGAYSHNRLKNMFFGSFTTKMLLNAKKPVVLF